jgi:hypothetical protein
MRFVFQRTGGRCRCHLQTSSEERPHCFGLAAIAPSPNAPGERCMPTKLPGKEILGGGLADESGEYLEVAGSIPARRKPIAQW